MSIQDPMSFHGSCSRATDRETCPCNWVRVSWHELVQLCCCLAEQLRTPGRPEAVVALARAGYVPGAILASLLRCDLLTLRVPATHEANRLAAEQSAIASLQSRLAGRRVLVLDESTHTGESLAWAVRVTTAAGAVAVRTAVLFRLPGSPAPDYHVAVAEGHFLQPWVQPCLNCMSDGRSEG